MFISYAQNGEDIVLRRVFGDIESGTYVDVGAADPSEYSVTKAFYDRGWSGVNIEPAPEFVEALAAQRDRDVNIALCAGEPEGPTTLHYVPGTGLSTLTDDHLGTIADQNFEVVTIDTEVKRLDNILSEAGLSGRAIHFLKIDVEGAEESVLRSIDLSTWRPWVVVVEATEPTTTEQNHQSWEPILLTAGYQFCLFDGLNRFYLAVEHADLTAKLSYPAGVFDQPYTVGAGQLELAERAEALVVERDELAASYARLQTEHHRGMAGLDELTATYHASLQSYESLHAGYDAAIAAFEDLDARHVAATNGFAMLEAEHRSALEAYDSLEAMYQETLASYSRLHGEYDNVLAAYHRLRGEHDPLVAGRDRLEAEVGRLERSLAVARHDLAIEREQARATAAALHAELAAVHATRSWKVTKPLRALGGKR